MTDLPEPRPRVTRRRYKIAGPRTWALAQKLYLAGLPAREVAERLGISEHALRKRAWKEGWSRRAHAQTVLDLELPPVGGDRRSLRLGDEAQAPFTPEPEDELEPADPAEAADALVRQAATLARAGRADEALRLLRTAAALRREAALTASCEAATREDAPMSQAQMLEAMRRYVDEQVAVAPDWPWSLTPGSLEDALLLRAAARMGLLAPPPQGGSAVARTRAWVEAFEKAQAAAIAALQATQADAAAPQPSWRP